MLEKAPDNALDADIFGKPWNTRPQAADAAHHKINLHTRLARPIERIDNAGIHQRIELGPDLRRAARLGMVNLFLDVLQQPGFQIDGR